jgi:hypothetical protein
MIDIQTVTANASAPDRSGRIFLLELSGDRIHSMDPGRTNRTMAAQPKEDGR